MKPFAHVKPEIKFELDELSQKDIDEDYASQILSKDDVTVLSFKNVEDHIDGNGLSILWLISGDGNFYIEGSPVSMKTGDIFVFDDRLEHGFEANKPCMAVNIGINQYKEWNIKWVEEQVQKINNQEYFRPKVSHKI